MTSYTEQRPSFASEPGPDSAFESACIFVSFSLFPLLSWSLLFLPLLLLLSTASLLSLSLPLLLLEFYLLLFNPLLSVVDLLRPCTVGSLLFLHILLHLRHAFVPLSQKAIHV